MKNPTSQPLITTLIPTYRRPALLRKAILSVLRQTYPHFVVHVYDNASGDETAEVVGELARTDSRVKYHCHPSNIGAIQNFNYGMERVTTPFFSLLSDDNTLLPDFFEDATTALNRHREAILFAGQTLRCNEQGVTLGGSLDRWKAGLITPPAGLLDIMEKGIPNWESVLFRVEVINSVGLLESAVHGVADQDFMMRIARSHKFYVTKKPYAYFLFHNNSWSSNRDINERLSSYKQVVSQWLKDEGLSASVKKRIRKKWRDSAKKVISSYVYNKCIIGEESEAISTAVTLMKQEVGLSLKPLAAIVVAIVANHNVLSKRLVSPSVRRYLQLKNKIILKKRKLVGGVTTPIYARPISRERVTP